MRKRLKAYTLMEVTIAMLLAGVVVGITYTVYFIVVRSYGSYTIKNTASASVVLLDKLLSKDIENAALVEATDTGLVCRATHGTVSYQFLPAYIIRNYGITDTFKVEVQAVKYLFERKAINGSGPSDETVKLDELQLELRFRGKAIINHYYKTYSSAELFKQYSHAVN